MTKSKSQARKREANTWRRMIEDEDQDNSHISQIYTASTIISHDTSDEDLIADEDTPSCDTSSTFDLSQLHIQMDAQQSVNFETLLASERTKFYKQLYKDSITSLQHFSIPPSCSIYPQLADEIMLNYLQSARFSCKVWLNYDMVDKDFYYKQERYTCCGKIKLPESVRIRLQELALPGFSKLQIELCTPWTSIARVLIDCRGEPAVNVLPACDFNNHKKLKAIIDVKVEQLQTALREHRQQCNFFELQSVANHFITPLSDGYGVL